MSLNISWLMAGENSIIAGCYFVISYGIVRGIWRNRQAGISTIVVAVACIFFSCAVGHGFHAVGMFVEMDHGLVWQTAADFMTILVAIRFLSFYDSFDLLSRISQIVASKSQLESQNQELEYVIKELKKTQSQLIQSEKMSSLGQLVAGIAHEVNNPISFIHGNLIQLQQYTQEILDLLNAYRQTCPSTPTEERLRNIEADMDFIQEDLLRMFDSMTSGTDRIRKIVLSLRNFSRLDEADLKLVDIHDGLESTLLLVQHRLKNKINIPDIVVVRAYGDLPLVECYPGELNQVLMNILSNAIDALDEMNASYHDVALQRLPLQIRIHTEVVKEKFVKIAITDNGMGIPEVIRQQIFDPFFTTKRLGQGTGMGLSISYQIITEKHRGKLECISQNNQGTEFVILIPIRQTL